MRFTEACLKRRATLTTPANRWLPEIWQMAPAGAGPDCMAAISSPQYVWTLLTKPWPPNLASVCQIAGHPLAAGSSCRYAFPLLKETVSGKIWPGQIDRYWHGDGGNQLRFPQVNGLATLWLVYGCMGGLDRDRLHRRCRPDGSNGPPQQRGFTAGAVAAATGWGPS